jgi:hypothetical protein
LRGKAKLQDFSTRSQKKNKNNKKEKRKKEKGFRRVIIQVIYSMDKVDLREIV